MSESDCVVIRVPQENVNDEHVRVVQWSYQEGEEVEAGAVIVELETSKASFELTAERAGFLYYTASEGAEVRVGAPLATIGDRPEKPDIWLHPETPETGETPKAESSGRPTVTAKARKLMAEHGLTEDAFAGLDKIKAEDVLALVSGGPEKPAWSRPDLPGTRVDVCWRKGFEIRMLSAAAGEVIPSTITIPVDAVAVDRALDALGGSLGITVTRGEWVLACVSRVLERYPAFNGYFDGEAMFLYAERDIGYAMNLGKGLKVPVVKSADKQELKTLVGAVKDLALRYMRDELTPGELAQPTFTVTDLVASGVTHFIPVLPAGQAAILGICATQPGGTHFNLVLTFDHRMADGMEAAEFLQQLRTQVQEPMGEQVSGA